MILYPPPRAIRHFTGTRPRPENLVYWSDCPLAPRLDAALKVLGAAPSSSSSSGAIKLVSSSRLPQQAYRVSTSETQPTVYASSDEGFHYGMRTLRHVIAQSDESLPIVEIDDSPDLASRGYMLDVSRCKVPSMNSLFELVDLLAELKYNQLQLYTEHTFAYRNHSAVWQDASPLTPEEIRQLDDYCHDRFIELVPNQNSFGHMERWLRHEAYKCFAESPGGFQHPLSGWKDHGSTMKPTTESADFVDSLYEELLPNFRSRNLNIGGDEPWELGQGFSADLVAKRGKHRVYLDHLLALHHRVHGRGRRIQFWGDIVIEKPDLVPELPDDVTALLWGYEADHPFAEQCATMRQAGVTYYVVPGTSTWNSIGGRLRNAFANIESAARNAIEHESNGLLLTEWGDNGHHQSHLLSILPIIFAGGMSWNFKHTRQQDLKSVANSSLLPNPLSSRQYRAILALSQASECCRKPLHNGTWLNKILFTNPANFSSISNALSPQELHKAAAALGEIEADDELALARDLLIYSCQKGNALLENRTYPFLDDTILERFRAAWLRRNRPGGLAESLNNLVRANS